MTSLATLPGFLAYLATGILLLTAAMAIYIRVTPYNEITLIRANNVGAAVTLGGAMIGFCMPIASAFAHSINIVDAAVWSLVALAVQIACFFAVSKLLGDSRAAIERGEVAGAILKASVSVSVGLLNAACLST
ncbi:DUF350 domain-containing protein [Falsiroseomonas oryziterrae]|uniref:DUF350 domain-containing protein n=1 Tax=Falsiroseomonas oryziterrae TaxID=2911368 RepID=UPI001F431A95|nr:DUF350 domain-containing protein [Roseomonas sp. NPKOSM-4]